MGSFPETLIDHPLLSNTFGGEGEGLSTTERSASSCTRSLSTTPCRVRKTRKNENKEQKQMKGKENHFVIIYEKEGKEEEKRKKEKKKRMKRNRRPMNKSR